MKRTLLAWTAALAGLFAVSLVGAPTGASAQSKKKVNKKLKLYSKKLDELADKDEWGTTEKDRQIARKSLKRARELLAQGSVEKAEWLVTRAGDRVGLIEALIQVRRIQAMAEDQEKKAQKHREKTIPDLKSEIEKLKERKAELEEKLSDLK